METPEYLTVKQFVARHPAFTTGGIRSALFYQGEKLEQAGAVSRMGRRVLINEPAFLAFVAAGGLRNIRGAA